MSSLTGYAKSYDTFCFGTHIKESISINTERRKIYAELTDGRSDPIFNKLISAEYVTLAPAAYFDLKALPYQKNGMPLFCHEFMSMIRTPKFDPSTRIIPKEQFKPFDLKFYKKRLVEAIKNESVAEVKKVAVEALLELKKQPNYYCFTRHFVESIYRFAYFTPIRSQEAEEMELKDPKKMMFSIMKLHTVALNICHDIDLMSQPIQMSGIPILCTEIPDLMFDLDVPELQTHDVR